MPIVLGLHFSLFNLAMARVQYFLLNTVKQMMGLLSSGAQCLSRESTAYMEFCVSRSDAL